jgi:hypothetical protein
VAWVWRLENADGSAPTGLVSPSHASQSDAESWLGENWRELSGAGVARVSLVHDGELAYGPMSLSE